MIIRAKIKNFYLFTVRYDKHPYGKDGAIFTFRLGRGAGYRWIDFPGYQMSINAPWYRKLSISGRTFTVITHPKKFHSSRGEVAPRFGRIFGNVYVTSLTRKCNGNVFPNWY